MATPETAEATQTLPGWDLEHLLEGSGVATAADGDDAGRVDALLDEAGELAERFAAEHEGKVAELDSAGLRAAMLALARISELVGRAGSYAQLAFSANTADPETGALMQRVTERATQVQTKLIFFELEWVALDDARAAELLAGEGLEFCRHHLELERRYKPHVLSKPEELIVTELSVTGRSAWSRLFDELTSAIRVEVPGGEPAPLDVALSRLRDPDREVRRATAEAVTEALEPGLRTRGYVFNTLLQDKAIGDRLRDYPHWVAARNLSNEASDESVQALVEAVQGRYELARRWYRVKARLLGIDRLADYDRMASVSSDDVEIPWDEGRVIVRDAFGSFSDRAAEVFDRFIDERWVDAPPREGKRGGAFSAPTVPEVHPYVMLNYTDTRNDVLTLAHELGHGLHQTLARDQGAFHQNTPLTVAETASVFAEQVVFGRLLAGAETPESRLSLLAEAVEGQIATVFRQIAMNRFEDAVHRARRTEGELSVERFGELWSGTQADLLGSSVELTDGYRSWWSYVPHFIGAPGYVYAYAYGQLLALSVYRKYESEGEAMVPAYLEMLAAGGSRSPEELGEIVGVDLADPGFWDSGLDLVAEQISAAEAAAEELIAARG
ncbi:MAG TPA: M3 family oligoendopeptidase [Solirubrobacterales bacterium]